MHTALPFLAAVSGSGLISILVQLLVIALIFWVLWWALSQIGVPEPFNRVIRVILVVAAAVIVINALLSLVGGGFIAW